MAFIISLAIIAVAVAGYMLMGKGSIAQRIFQLLGGQMPSGIIQLLTYVAFFWGIFEINSRTHRVKYEETSLNLELLPEQEQWVLSPDDVNDLKLKMIDYKKEHDFLMVDVIRKACTKFRADKSISDVLEVVSRQIRINMNKAESKQSIIRYLAWAIPSIGFIGTIIGIAQSLGYADQASSEEGLSLVTSAMYVAFDTTLISLILSIFLMWFFHALQEREEALHSDMEEYVMENLINRIHVE